MVGGAGVSEPERAQGDAAASTRGGASAAPQPIALPEGFRSYAWATPTAQVAARSGVPPAQVLRFDQNTPPLPGVPQVPLAESFARLNEYPDGLYRELREAAASYVGNGTSWEQVVVGAGADDLILLCARTYLGPGGARRSRRRRTPSTASPPSWPARSTEPRPRVRA